MDEKKLMEELAAKQVALGETDTAFAARLGVSDAMWKRMKKGQRFPGRQSLKVLARAFPGLVREFLFGPLGSKKAG